MTVEIMIDVKSVYKVRNLFGRVLSESFHSWDFGDPNGGANNTTTVKNPTYTYTTPGTYTVTVTDALLCSATTVLVITEPAAIVPTVTSTTAVSCNAGNNGSAMAGLNANTAWYNTTLGISMLLGRFGYVVPVMAIAGSLAAKVKSPASAGTFPTDGPLFVGLLVGIILILGGLQFLPALVLGPIVEHFAMLAGQTF